MSRKHIAKSDGAQLLLQPYFRIYENDNIITDSNHWIKIRCLSGSVTASGWLEKSLWCFRTVYISDIAITWPLSFSSQCKEPMSGGSVNVHVVSMIRYWYSSHTGICLVLSSRQMCTHFGFATSANLFWQRCILAGTLWLDGGCHKYTLICRRRLVTQW